MHSVAVLFGSTLVALAFAAAADSDLVVFASDGRYVYVNHCPAFDPCESDTRRPPNSFGAFDDAASGEGMSASQQSGLSVGPEMATMSGTLGSGSSSEPPLGTTLGDAVFDISFDLADPATFSWSGLGTLSGGGYGSAFLYDVTTGNVVFEAGLPADRSEAGNLEAGHRYRLFHSATTQGQGSAAWDFELSLVPEPARPAGLLAGALALWALTRSSRGERRS